MIYFIEAPALAMIKIGYAEKPWSRLSKIQSDNACHVKMIALEPGGYARECELHAQFSDIPRRGEWFQDVPAIRAHIATLEPIKERLPVITPYRHPVKDARSALDDYLNLVGATPGAFARALGCDRSNFHKLLKEHHRLPSLELATQIERSTSGMVPASAWIA